MFNYVDVFYIIRVMLYTRLTFHTRLICFWVMLKQVAVIVIEHPTPVWPLLLCQLSWLQCYNTVIVLLNKKKNVYCRYCSCYICLFWQLFAISRQNGVYWQIAITISTCHGCYSAIFSWNLIIFPWTNKRKIPQWMFFTVINFSNLSWA